MFNNTMIKYILNNIKILSRFGILVAVFDIGYLIQYYQGDQSAIPAISFISGMYAFVMIAATVGTAFKFNKMTINTKTQIKESLLDKFKWVNKVFK